MESKMYTTKRGFTLILQNVTKHHAEVQCSNLNDLSEQYQRER